MRLPPLRCKTCTACCEREQIPLTAEDDPSLYDVQYVAGIGLVIAPREDGSPACRYLGRRGCTIYAHRPKLCRDFDCRPYFLSKTPAEIEARLKASPSTARTFKAAIERLGPGCR
jgi:Putative zinc- or iron-chelating domain